MARRNTRDAGARSIRGPQSALTDFLASNNISAAQIRADFEARLAAATQSEQTTSQNQESTHADEENENEDEEEDQDVAVSRAPVRKRKRASEAVAERLKKSRLSKKRKSGGGDDGDEEGDEDDLGFDMYSKSRRVPGQLEHCEICDKRFTVTPYSKEGPSGGLLCTKCGKDLKDEQKKAQRKANKPVQRKGRRQVKSDLLDGLVRHGSKSLVDLCVEKVANVSNDIEEFGDLGDNDQIMSKLSAIFSRRRVLKPRTSKLFLRSDYHRVTLYDCADLETQDYQYIFSVAHNIKHLNLRNASQMKDETLDYLMSQGIMLETIRLEGCNLITNDKWREFFKRGCKNLKNLKLCWLDYAFDDEAVASLIKGCPKLVTLKLKFCNKVTEQSVASIAKLKSLENLSLSLNQPVSTEAMNDLVSSRGAKLKTLSLDKFDCISDETLQVIHEKCHQLKKLRITHNDYSLNAGFESLFKGWENPALEFVDLDSSRDIDNQNPEGPEEEPVGLGDAGLQAIMDHSGLKLKTLLIPSCRHITHQTLADIFDGKKLYPLLEEIDLSLIPEVDDVVVRGVFRSCPKIKKLTVFACFGVKEVVVPSGVALIGTPHAHEAIVQEGTALG